MDLLICWLQFPHLKFISFYCKKSCIMISWKLSLASSNGNTKTSKRPKKKATWVTALRQKSPLKKVPRKISFATFWFDRDYFYCWRLLYFYSSYLEEETSFSKLFYIMVSCRNIGSNSALPTKHSYLLNLELLTLKELNLFRYIRYKRNFSFDKRK